MFEVIIGYLFITAVIYSITREKRISFTWPIAFIIFISEGIRKGVKSFKKERIINE
jgi:hypothetical protein